MSTFISDSSIEREASALLSRFQKRTGGLALPVPIEEVVDHDLDLQILWDALGRDENLTLAGLKPGLRQIVFNEDARLEIMETSGLYHTILAHEAGHWSLQADQGQQFQTSLPGLGGVSSCIYKRGGNPRGFDEVQAHKFMGYVLMPYELLRAVIDGRDLSQWRTLYEVRDVCGVTISSLVKRLEGLRLISVDSRTKQITDTTAAVGRLI